MPDLLDRLGSRVKAVHLKDGDGSRDDSKQVAFGTGAIDTAAILAACAGVDLGVIELDDTTGDMFTAVQDSYTHLVKALSGVVTAPQRGPVGIGIIGAGVISGTYLENLTSFPDVQVHAIGDLYPEAASRRAAEHGVPAHGGIDTVLTHEDVEIVINLTIPAAHVEVSLAAIGAGKHVWSEKPVALDREGGARLLAAAQAAGVRLGCAPDTFLGVGLQTALAVLRRGDIGTPLSALTLMQSPGPESWHPNPAFLFQHGAGPLFDIGPTT